IMSSTPRSTPNQRPIPVQSVQPGIFLYGDQIVYGGNACPVLPNVMVPNPPMAAHGQRMVHQQQQQQQRHRSVGPPILRTAQRAQMRREAASIAQPYQSSGTPARTRPSPHKHNQPQQQQQQQSFGNWPAPPPGGPAMSPHPATPPQYNNLALMQQLIQLQQQQLQQQQIQLQLQAALGTSYGLNINNQAQASASGDTGGWSGYAMMQPSDANKPYSFGCGPDT
ncbi:hypothetical protein KR009_005400, partial [Drosophila setifemur]